jgi:hypothetical protein
MLRIVAARRQQKKAGKLPALAYTSQSLKFTAHYAVVFWSSPATLGGESLCNGASTFGCLLGFWPSDDTMEQPQLPSIDRTSLIGGGGMTRRLKQMVMTSPQDMSCHSEDMLLYPKRRPRVMEIYEALAEVMMIQSIGFWAWRNADVYLISDSGASIYKLGTTINSWKTIWGRE